MTKQVMRSSMAIPNLAAVIEMENRTQVRCRQTPDQV
jgi:hypothetical protein